MSKRKKTSVIIAVHIIVWLVFLSLPTLFNPRRTGFSIGDFIADLTDPPRFANGLLLIAVFYFNYYIAIPKLYLQRKYLLLLLSFVFCFGLFFLLNQAMIPAEFKNPYETGPIPGGPMRPGNMAFLGPSFNLFMFLIVYASSFTVCVYEQWQQAKTQMLNAQISFLKAQINPHFLFNTLNSIYSLAIVKSDEAPDAIIKLSNMMRYTVSYADHTYVSLSNEISYITNYIDLQRLRLADKVKIRYEISGIDYDMQIAPFQLIPFVENAFKYGVNPEEDSDINIRIDVKDGELKMLVTNNKVYLRPDIERGTGIGISTTRKRLQFMYPGKHILSVSDEPKSFKVLLQITLI